MNYTPRQQLWAYAGLCLGIAMGVWLPLVMYRDWWMWALGIAFASFAVVIMLVAWTMVEDR